MNNLALSYARHSLTAQHNKLRDLQSTRRGIIIKKGLSALSFCARLATLMQDIAREKYESLRLLLLVDHFEKALRLEKKGFKEAKVLREKRLALGKTAVLPAGAPRRPKRDGLSGLMLFLFLKLHTPSPKE